MCTQERFFFLILSFPQKPLVETVDSCYPAESSQGETMYNNSINVLPHDNIQPVTGRPCFAYVNSASARSRQTG